MNEYLKRVIDIDGLNPNNWKVWERRSLLVQQYAWAIPDDEAIKTIVKYSPIVEMGAGTGYWAGLISSMGGDIICFDEVPPHPLNLYGENHFKHYKQYYKVQKGTPQILQYYKNRTLLLCWAPYNTSMAEACLEYYQGDTLIWIGEGWGGCNGTDGFFKKLKEQFKRVDYIAIPQWTGIHDYLSMYKRRKAIDISSLF